MPARQQINDISVASNEGTINPVTCHLPLGSASASTNPDNGCSQTLARQVFQRENDRKLGQIGLWWLTHWDSPLRTWSRQGGDSEILPGPQASALEGLFAPKAKQKATVILGWVLAQRQEMGVSLVSCSVT